MDFCLLGELDLTLFYKIEGYFEKPKSLMTLNDTDLNDPEYEKMTASSWGRGELLTVPRSG